MPQIFIITGLTQTGQKENLGHVDDAGPSFLKRYLESVLSGFNGYYVSVEGVAADGLGNVTVALEKQVTSTRAGDGRVSTVFSGRLSGSVAAVVVEKR